MANPALSAIGFILGILFNLYATVVAIRFVMQVVRADYYNPVAQAIVSVTDPLLIPLRRLIPSFRRYDTASLVLCFAVLLVKLLVFKFLSLGAVSAIGLNYLPAALPAIKLIIAAVLDVIHQLFNVLNFALIVQAIMSWIPNAVHHPVYSLVSTISAPVLKPLRNILPPLGGLDLSVFFTIIGLFAIRIFFLGTLRNLFGV